jgi:flavin-binding protein dodecin
MADTTYTIVDVVGVSEDSIHQAVRNALTKAGQTLRNLDWFEVKNIRGGLVSERGGIPSRGKIGFRMEDSHS